jgi:hypothetical protein
MKYIITESQLKLLHEMSDDIPMFIKRRLSAINDALEHATSPDSVVQPEDYNWDYDYVDDVFNAVMDELSWEVFNDGLTEEQELELRDYLMEYHSDEIMDHYRMYVDDDEDDEDLFESEDEMISEQKSTSRDCKVWVESKSDPKYIKYVSALNLYMRGKSIVDYFKQNPNATNGELNKKEDELKIKYPVNKKYDAFGSEMIHVGDFELHIVGTGRAARNAPQYPKPDKVCIKPKPLPTPLPVSKPTQTPKTTPPTIQSTLDKTKPVDFYFGNRILRAPDYVIAKKFAEKLAIRNFNSNQVFVYKDKNNEKWFIGANDKIYLNQDLYNQDPNKNVYVDPVKMGLSAL